VVDVSTLPRAAHARHVDNYHPNLLCIWRHRNYVVFNGATLSLLTIREKIKVEYDRWCLAKIFRGVLFSFPEPVDLPW
jgi:hypothetical protein